jgi:hypothetical protein
MVQIRKVTALTNEPAVAKGFPSRRAGGPPAADEDCRL